MTTYHFVAASERFLTEEEPLEEVLKESLWVLAGGGLGYPLERVHPMGTKMSKGGCCRTLPRRSGLA